VVFSDTICGGDALVVGVVLLLLSEGALSVLPCSPDFCSFFGSLFGSFFG
jgi:hypothetical protein